MRPSSPANRRAAALVALALAPAAAAAAAPVPIEPSAHYQFCLKEAHSAPKEALAGAEDWRHAGGGFPAEHCAAVALFELKRYAEAARKFEALAGQMMAQNPALRAGALDQAGQAWLLDGRPEAAAAAFRGALKLVPDDADFLIDRARADAAAARWQDAVAALDEALKHDPKRADALVFRASAYRELGALVRARADADRALALAPDNVAAHLERGNIRRLAGDAAGARADWRAVEQLGPGTQAAAAAHDNLAALAADAR
jgi:tetratricopeptide (TPR) repeat protein